ncbi:hypothetical protein QC761_203820 [Podospora bellae-mahoneyi]|uniref:Mediator of RNA polymerase II transcription subunit 11 n=1 Tax=Podospora bellae-mahoneyi TaxID=2093777 RepID=A0ABR0FNZ3_9PEZI|nr:hypothetical protein QC761_203820 [Podospora bellae-mahoneyi]
MNPQPPTPQEQPIDIHTPFTLPEHLSHLASTDRDITSLLTPVIASLTALSTPPSPTSPNAPQEAFKSAQTSYFRTIDRISKHLNRQIYALEEANIISLAATSSNQQPSQSAENPDSQPGASQPDGTKDTKKVARLDPDGTGKYGKLDVGRLNLASSTTERDVEAETWERVKAHFAGMAEAQGVNTGDRMQE